MPPLMLASLHVGEDQGLVEEGADNSRRLVCVCVGGGGLRNVTVP
jgi:hypothetical protein